MAGFRERRVLANRGFHPFRDSRCSFPIAPTVSSSSLRSLRRVPSPCSYQTTAAAAAATTTLAPRGAGVGLLSLRRTRTMRSPSPSLSYAQASGLLPTSPARSFSLSAHRATPPSSSSAAEAVPRALHLLNRFRSLFPLTICHLAPLPAFAYVSRCLIPPASSLFSHKNCLSFSPPPRLSSCLPVSSRSHSCVSEAFCNEPAVTASVNIRPLSLDTRMYGRAKSALLRSADVTLRSACIAG